VSLLKDYSEEKGLFVLYQTEERKPEWFRELSEEQQTAFVPLDRWVIRGAKKAGALPHSLAIEAVQGAETRTSTRLTGSFVGLESGR
jgi:hypothetical protein